MTESDVLRLLASLGLIVALIFLLAWMSRRVQQLRGGKQAALRVIAAQSLGGRASVAIIEAEGSRLVVGVTPSQVTLLHTLPPEAPARPDAAPEREAGPDSGDFARHMASALGKS